MTVRYTETNPWSILFQIHGSIWNEVLSFCIVNCIWTCIIIYWEKYNQDTNKSISFSPQGHGFIGLLVSFLVLNKLYFAVDRYNTIRSHIGHATITLRELYQLILTFTTTSTINTDPQSVLLYHHEDNDNDNNDRTVELWQDKIRNNIYDVLETTIEVLQDDKKACYLARNEKYDTTTTIGSSNPTTKESITISDYDRTDSYDPLYYTLVLRQNLYSYNDYVGASTTTNNNNNTATTTNSTSPKYYYCKKMELLERMKLLDMILMYTASYRELLRIVSTPLPFPMIQMGRTFVFLWIYTMPLALIGLDVQVFATVAFVFFITYGYIGLELVSIQLLHPFGKSNGNDLDISGIVTATQFAIESDHYHCHQRNKYHSRLQQVNRDEQQQHIHQQRLRVRQERFQQQQQQQQQECCYHYQQPTKMSTRQHERRTLTTTANNSTIGANSITNATNNTTTNNKNYIDNYQLLHDSNTTYPIETNHHHDNNDSSTSLMI